MRKYGFKAYILQDHINQNDAEYIESRLVNKEFIARADTLNLIVGGATSPMTNPEIVKKMVGRYVSQETRAKQSAAKKGKAPWNKDKKGIYTKEALRLMSENSKGKEPHNKGKTGLQGRNKTSFTTESQIGEKHHNTKITDKDRREIYNRYKAGAKPKLIADEYGIHWSNIYRAIKYIEKELT